MATRKNFKKTGKKRIKPKGGAKKRKTVRGGVWPWTKPAPVGVIDTKNEPTVEEWFTSIKSTFEELKDAYKESGHEVNPKTILIDTKYKSLKETFSSLHFQKNIKEYLNALDDSERSQKLKILEDLDLHLK